MGVVPRSQSLWLQLKYPAQKIDDPRGSLAGTLAPGLRTYASLKGGGWIARH